MKTLIFGRGFLGTRLSREISGAVLSDLDITDEAAMLRAIERERPDAVVNAAGKTGKPNVDWCEAHREETYRSNVEGALALARCCSRANVYLLHLGSGCIFYGPSPSPGGWRESDFANPKGFYSKTKYAADLVLSALPNVAIVRLRMPIDHEPGTRNLITKLAGYAQVIDVENSVTVIDDLVAVVAGLVERRAAGTFHATNPGTMRHRDLLRLYRELVDPAHTCELIRDEDLVARGLATAPRSNCILASENLARVGLAMRPIEVALNETMRRYARAHGTSSRGSA